MECIGFIRYFLSKFSMRSKCFFSRNIFADIFIPGLTSFKGKNCTGKRVAEIKSRGEKMQRKNAKEKMFRKNVQEKMSRKNCLGIFLKFDCNHHFYNIMAYGIFFVRIPLVFCGSFLTLLQLMLIF